MAETCPDDEEDLAVLIVDDEARLVEGLAAGLGAAGYATLVAGSANEALAHLDRRSDIGVVITDIRMPDRDGLDLARDILAQRAEASAVEVIAISGHATMETAATAVSVRVSALLYKPFRLAALLAAVETAMTQAHRRRSAWRGTRRSSSHLAALELERHQLVEWLDQARERLAALADDSLVARAVEAEAAEIARALRGGPGTATNTPTTLQAKALETLRDEVERSTSTVGLLEELHGLGARSPDETAQRVALSDLFARVCRFRAPDLDEKGLVLEPAAWDARTVVAAPHALERVLDRVLQTVIECSPSGSRIAVSAPMIGQPGGSRIALDLTTGRAREAEAPDQGHTPHGLLAFEVARRRAEMIGGEFSVVGDEPGSLTFRLALNAAPPPT